MEKSGPDWNNVLEVGGVVTAMVCLTVLVALGHGEWGAELKGLIVVYAARGMRGIISPKRASDAQPALAPSKP